MNALRSAARKALRNLVRWYDAGLVAGDPPMSRFESARAVVWPEEVGEDHGVGPAPLPGTNVAPASAPKSGDPSGFQCRTCGFRYGQTERLMNEGRAAEREEIAADLLGAAGDAWVLDSTLQDVFTFLAKRIRARGAAGATREPSAPGSLEGAS